MSNDQQPVSHPGAHEYVLEYSVFTFRTENSVPSGRGTRIPMIGVCACSTGGTYADASWWVHDRKN